MYYQIHKNIMGLLQYLMYCLLYWISPAFLYRKVNIREEKLTHQMAIHGKHSYKIKLPRFALPISYSGMNYMATNIYVQVNGK